MIPSDDRGQFTTYPIQLVIVITIAVAFAVVANVTAEIKPFGGMQPTLALQWSPELFLGIIGLLAVFPAFLLGYHAGRETDETHE